MSDKTENETDESVLLSADRTSNSEFFIDDYSHLRLSYYQYRDNHRAETICGDNISLSVSDSTYQDSAYSTNASTNESYHENSTNSTNTTDVSCRENNYLNNTTINSTSSTNATNSQDLNEEEKSNATHESCLENIDLNNTTQDSTISTNATNSKVLNEDERRKLREYLVSQIPDLPHPSYTAASIIASASHRMDPSNRFVYNNRIEQGNRRDDFEMETFTPERRSTLKPDTKL